MLNSIIIADVVIAVAMITFWVWYLRGRHKRRVAYKKALVPCALCHFFDTHVEGCGLWYGIPRDVSDGCLYGERVRE